MDYHIDKVPKSKSPLIWSWSPTIWSSSNLTRSCPHHICLSQHCPNH